MRFAEADTSGGYLIQAYGPGRIRVNGREFSGSLILTPQRIVDNWRPESSGELRAMDFEAILALGPELAILGTGIRQEFPKPGLYRSLMEAGVGIEIMDTAAACRTYNILMSEGRRVAAALLML